MRERLPTNQKRLVFMNINKHILNRALRVLGKVACQTSTVELLCWR